MMTADHVPADADLTINNVNDAPVNGPMVLAGTITGGVHLHDVSQRLPAPQQLPIAPASFVGREWELGALAVRTDRDAVVIYAAPAGIGKTWLALRWAHRNLNSFPDGVLHANLRGFGPDRPVAPDEVLEGFLQGLGIAAERTPPGLEARAALFRSLLAGRQALILLDNAHDADQVRPLLPGTPGCIVVVTSRDSLSGLVVTESAQRVPLDVFSENEARQLVTGVIGAARADLEPRAVTDLIRWCGRLPLALRVAACRVAAQPHTSVAAVVADLADDKERLDVLSRDRDERATVRAVFDWSYLRLPADQAELFRRLSSHPGSEFGLSAAAALSDLEVSTAGRLLDALTAVHLIELVGERRYRFHDLLRTYALDRSAAVDSPRAQEAVARRAVRWYLHAAVAAARKLTANMPVRDFPDPPAHWLFPEHTTPAEARTWFEAEEGNLVSAIRRAVELAEHGVAWRLPEAVTAFWYVFNKRWELWWEMMEIALAHARLDDELGGEAMALNIMGIICNDRRRHEEAVGYYTRALDLFAQTRERWSEAIAHNALGNTFVSLGRHAEAMRSLGAAADAFDEIGSEFGQAWVTQGRAAAHNAMGDHRTTLELAEKALAAWENIDYTHGVGSGHNLLGDIHLAIGQFGSSLVHYDRAVDVRRSIDDRFGTGMALRGKGTAQFRLGRADEAGRTLRQALSILDELTSPEAAEVVKMLAELER